MGWRDYQAADEWAVKALLLEAQARWNITFDVPNLNERPILKAMVYEQDGVITHAAVLEAEAEIMTVGKEGLPLGEWDEVATEFTQVCCAYRLRLARAFVPLDVTGTSRGVVRSIVGALKRFHFKREKKSQVAVFTRWI